MENLVRPDPGLFIWTIVVFLVLLTLLRKFAWRPLLQALEARQQTIRQSLDDADRAKKELQRLQDESAKIVRDARVEAEAIVSRSRSDAERVKEEIRQKARTDAESIIRTAERQIQLETQQALRQIRQEAAEMSIAIASKLIQRNLSKDDNQRLIDEALKQIETRVEPIEQ
jgi:F-type H+-transporting ATPase subunit b